MSDVHGVDDGEEGSGGIWWLLLLCIMMLCGSFAAGMVPLVMQVRFRSLVGIAVC